MNMLESISGYDFAVIDGYAYFSNVFYNALFKVEVETGNTTFLGNFEDEMLSENNVHLEIMVKDDRIYFFPRRGRHMHIYRLSDGTIQSVEIRKSSEPFYVIEEIILEDDCVYFIPKQKDNPVKRLDINTYKIIEVKKGLKSQKKYLSKYRNIIPAAIIEKYKIEHGSQTTCRQMTDGKWYCFMPIGREMIRFAKGIYNLETIPLTVVNEAELQEYLRKVKQHLFKARILFPEFQGFKFQDYAEVIMLSNGFRCNHYKDGKGYSIGRQIWNIMER